MYIGLDLGTSGLKGILINDDQKVLAEAVAPLTVQRPHEGWSEQAPDSWVTAAETVFEKLSAFGLSAVRGIGLSGHMHGATLLDAKDDVLRPCIGGAGRRPDVPPGDGQYRIPRLHSTQAGLGPAA
jgi:xylulokinase